MTERAKRSYTQKLGTLDSCSRLMLAVIVQAGVDLHQGTPTQKMEAARWIHCDCGEPMCFRWYCEQLDMSASALREGIKDNIEMRWAVQQGLL